MEIVQYYYFPMYIAAVTLLSCVYIAKCIQIASILSALAPNGVLCDSTNLWKNAKMYHCSSLALATYVLILVHLVPMLTEIF